MSQVTIQEHISLAGLTTFHIGGPARFYATITTVTDLEDAVSFAHKNQLKTFILGGGSNILIADRGFDGLVLHIDSRGISTVSESNDKKTVYIAAGENWDMVVDRLVRENLWGVENLSLIPGSVGAAPVQNIGAYGQEISDTLVSVDTYDTKEKKQITLSNAECRFSYRTSIFKTNARDRYIILGITLTLKKKGTAQVHYPDVKKYLKEHGIEKPSLSDMRKAIIAIRTRKLPDPAKIGNAGSFFKNITLSPAEYEKLKKTIQKNFDDQVVKTLEEKKKLFEISDRIKIPTAFLIELCGLKNTKHGGAIIWEKQPLIITNPDGNATAQDVMELAKHIREAVYEQTGIQITPEPDLIGFTKEEFSLYFGI